jgi:hypothetical protein
VSTVSLANASAEENVRTVNRVCDLEDNESFLRDARQLGVVVDPEIEWAVAFRRLYRAGCV